MNVIISPSMLSADFANLERDLKAVAASGAQWLHVDVMDGHFVPNITIGPDQVACIRKCIDLPFDVHLMISEPLKYIPKFAKAGADMITIHVESEDDPAACLALIKECGKKAGIVLSPDTPTSAIAPYLDAVSMVLVMSVYPGFGGQSYIPESTERLREIRAMIGSRDIRLEVDGGVNFDTLEAVVEAGADTIVSGSCLFNGDMTENVAKFNEIIATVVVE
ncbi:ribulose-phosphate 3-epimerase [Eubacterium barkeri]|uniref:Ribulose-phosphate 3-epimerase n=1 Tax=Eubacterium barkeri TaxID=1528 RepID=A0A1H3F5B6_EUBBA|nr:ribulose-phosphate 3-epimerase [Eubacterium barkeri]SDX86090.1 ribulose-phosphate 3-epimerase [Eubacterium barkeri]